MLLRQIKDAAAAASYASEWIVRNHHRQPGLLRDQFVDVAQQSPATGEYDAALRHIGAQIRRCLLQCLSHRTHDALQWLLEDLKNLIRIQGKTPRHTLREISSPDDDVPDLLSWIGRSDFQFDAL